MFQDPTFVAKVMKLMEEHKKEKGGEDEDEDEDLE